MVSTRFEGGNVHDAGDDNDEEAEEEDGDDDECMASPTPSYDGSQRTSVSLFASLQVPTGPRPQRCDPASSHRDADSQATVLCATGTGEECFDPEEPALKRRRSPTAAGHGEAAGIRAANGLRRAR